MHRSFMLLARKHQQRLLLPLVLPVEPAAQVNNFGGKGRGRGPGMARQRVWHCQWHMLQPQFKLRLQPCSLVPLGSVQQLRLGEH